MTPIRSADPWQLFELTTRTNERRFLLRPSDLVNSRVLGCIARAQHIYPVRIHAFVVMSNHYHLLVSARDAQQLSSFMCHLNGNMARKINRLLGREGRFWQRPFRSIPVSSEQEAQIDRLRYILSHGVKERLVRRAKDWPGASSLNWLTDGVPLRGVWQDQTAEFYKNRGKPADQHVDVLVEYELTMSPMPCWQADSVDAWRAHVIALVAELEASWLAEHGDAAVLGADAIRGQDPTDKPIAKPPDLRSRTAPKCHAATTRVREKMRKRATHTQALYAVASKAFREGRYTTAFPTGTHRPRGPFEHWPVDPPDRQTERSEPSRQVDVICVPRSVGGGADVTSDLGRLAA